MCTCHDIEGKQFWDRVEEADARDLVLAVVGAAKDQFAYSRALQASKRSVVLLGRGAGREHRLKAETHFRSRTSQLRAAKQLLPAFLEGFDDRRRKEATEFFRRDGVQDLVAHAKRTAVLALLDSDIRPEDARKASRALEAALEEIEGLTSVEEMGRYLHGHLDDLIGREMGNPALSFWCIFLLIITSLFALLVVLAAFICAVFAGGRKCEGIFQTLLAYACGSS